MNTRGILVALDTLPSIRARFADDVTPHTLSNLQECHDTAGSVDFVKHYREIMAAFARNNGLIYRETVSEPAA